MADLERDLRGLAAEIAWPATPDLAAVVAARIEQGAPATGRGPLRAPGRRTRRRLAVAVAALVLLVPAAALAFPGARDDVLEWLGLRHVTVERRPVRPAAREPALGPATTLAAAARDAGFRPLVVRGLGEPDAVHRRGDVVTLVYGDVLLAEAPGRLERALLHKIVAMDSTVRRVVVDGRPGLFFATPHDYFWLDPHGGPRNARPVRSGASLVWERAGVVLRLEGIANRRTALRLAAGATPSAP